jgi:hypothetical protein
MRVFRFLNGLVAAVDSNVSLDTDETMRQASNSGLTNIQGNNQSESLQPVSEEPSTGSVQDTTIVAHVHENANDNDNLKSDNSRIVSRSQTQLTENKDNKSNEDA